jgi:hypothetical protein
MHVLKAAGLAMVLCCGITTGADAQDEATIAGTYRIAVCTRPTCALDDTATAATWGVLILFNSPISAMAIPESARPLLTMYVIDRSANGCYAMRKPDADAQTYAGSSGVGVTSWSVRPDGKLTFMLYQSPDAGHSVQAVTQGDSLRGIGRTWRHFESSVTFPPDTVLAVKVGPPDITPCAEASSREWSRLQTPRGG